MSRRPFLCISLAALAWLAPTPAYAAENIWSRAWKQGPAAFAVTALLALFGWAVFIHVASGLTKLEHRSFGRAVKAAFISWVLTFAVPATLGLLFGLFGITSEAAFYGSMAAAVILPGTLAIRSAYEAGFAASLATHVVAACVTVGVLLGAVFALGMLAPGAA